MVWRAMESVTKTDVPMDCNRPEGSVLVRLTLGDRRGEGRRTP